MFFWPVFSFEDFPATLHSVQADHTLGHYSLKFDESKKGLQEFQARVKDLDTLNPKPKTLSPFFLKKPKPQTAMPGSTALGKESVNTQPFRVYLHPQSM